MRKNFTRTLLLPVCMLVTAQRKLYSFFLVAVLLFSLHNARAQGVCNSSTQIFGNASVPSTLVNNTFTNQGYNVGALSAYASFPTRQMATWAYCVVTKTGVINMNFGNTANGDFDWGVWGPFAPGRTIAEICASKMDNLPPIIVDNTTGPGLSGSVTATQVGQIYIVLMINWPLATTNCNLNFSGTGSIVPPPAITSFTPAFAANGNTVTITGTNFTSVTAVSFGGTAATSFTVVNATTITAVVPANASGTINVTTNSGIATSTSTFINITPQTRPGNALNFEGANNYVAVPSNAAFSFGTGDFTIEAWIKLTLSGVYIVAGRYDGTGNDYWLGTINGKAAFSISGASVTGATSVNDGKWHHIAGTRSSGTISVYVDGLQNGSLANGLGASPTGEFRVGAFYNNSSHIISYFFPGSIDEVRVYKTALSVGNIQSDMVNTTSSSPSNLLLYYNFDEGTAEANNAGVTTAVDQSGNNAHGILTSFTLNGATSNWVQSYPAVTALSPSVVSAASPAQVTITGTNFGTSAASITGITYGVSGTGNTVVAGTIVWVSPTQIKFTPSALTLGTIYKVIVTVNGTASAVSAATFNAVPQSTVTAISPVSVSTLIPTVVTLTGTNFGNSAADINSISATGTSGFTVSSGIVWVDATHIQFQTPAGLPPGVSYRVTVTVGGQVGVISTSLVTFSTVALPVATITPSGPVTFCAPGSVLLTAGTASTYKWLLNGSAISGQTSNTYTAMQSGVYTVQVTNAVGDVVTSSGKTVTVNPLPTATISGTATVCQNTAVLPITFTGTDGTSPYTFTYTINNGVQRTITSVGNTATINLTPQISQTYTYRLVSVKDASATFCSNTATGSAVITINALPTVTATGNSPVTAGGPINLSASGANTYAWTGPNSYSATGASISVTNSSSVNAGVYTVTGTTTATGCTNAAGTTVVVNTPATGLNFDGVNDYVSIPDNSDLNFGSGNFTVETWVNKKAGSVGFTNSGVIGKWNTGSSAGTNEWLLQTTTNGSNNIPSFWIEAGTTIYQCVGTTSMQLDTWYHLAAVREGTSLKIYVNGQLEGSLTIPANATINNTSLNMTLGAYRLSGTPIFSKMSMDELRIWNRALCQSEIQNNKDCELNAIGQTGLVSLYHFNQGLVGLNNGSKRVLVMPNYYLGAYIDVSTGWAIAADQSEYDPITHVQMLAPPAIPYTIQRPAASSFLLTYDAATEVLTAQDYIVVDLGTVTWTDRFGNTSPYDPAVFRVYKITSDLYLVDVTDESLLLDPVTLNPVAAANGYTMLATPATLKLNYADANNLVNQSNPGPVPSDIPVVYQLTNALGNNNGIMQNFALTGNTSNWTIGNATGTCTSFVTPTTPVTGVTAVCVGSTTALSNTTGGVWSSNNTTVATVTASGVVSGVSAGTAIISYTNNCGGISTATITVSAPTAAITAESATTFCAGGSVILTASAGTSYLWSNNATTPSITVNTAGSYSVTVTNANNCSATSAATSVTVNALPTVTVSPTSATVCAGNSTTLNAISVSGLVGYYKFDEASGSTTADASGNNLSGTLVSNVTRTSSAAFTGAGNALQYATGGNVTVPSSSQFSFTNTFTFEAWVNPASFNVNGNGFVNGSNFLFGMNWGQGGGGQKLNMWIVLQGAGYVLFSGGVIPAGTWSHIAATYNGSVVNLYINGALVSSTPETRLVQSGASGLTIGMGNAGSAQNFIGSMDELRIWNVARTQAQIQASMSSTIASSNATLFSWSPSTGLNTTTAATVSANPAITTTYTVTGTSATGCSSSATATVTVNPLPIATITAGSATTFCSGGQVILTASAGSSYLWSNNATTPSITVSTTGNYSVTVTNANNCSATSAVTSITVNALPTISGITTVCEGRTRLLTGTGTPAVTSPWTSSNTSICTVDNSGTVTGLVAGTAVITYTNSNGCSTTTNFTVVGLPPTPTVSVVNNCDGSSLLTASGFTNYEWRNGARTVVIATGPAFISVSTLGTFSVRSVNNSTGCVSAFAFVDAAPHTAPIATIAASGPTTFCSGGSVVLTASAGSSYLWSNNSTTQSITVSASGNYSVIVTGANNCSATSAETSVTVNALPTATTATTAVSCLGGSDGSITVTASNENPPYQYSKDGGSNYQPGNVFEGLTAGVYTVIVRSATNCLSVAQQVTVGTVADVTRPVPDIAALPVLTGECSVTASAVPTATDNCTGTITGTTTDPLSYHLQGTYTITWSYDDRHGNIQTQTQTVIVKDVTPPVANALNLPIITGECSATVTAAPTATDNCSGTITGTTSDALSYTAQGTYTITWTYDDDNHNISTQTQTVIVKDATAPVANVLNLPIITGECSATVTAAPTATDNCSGTITGTTSDALSYTAQGTYTITWTYDDGNHNTSTQTQTVIVKDVTAPVANVLNLPVITGECSATVTAAPTATDNCSGMITGTTSDALVYTAQGTYTITWTYDDGNHNTSTQTQTVIVKDVTAPVANVLNLPVITGECSATVTAAPTATDNCSGTITGTTSDVLSYTSQGTYIITWTYDDGNHNTSTQTQTVIVKDVTTPVFVFCQQNIDGVIAANASGASVSYATPVATDNCSVITVRTSGPVSGATFPIGTTTVTYTATDPAGNTATCSFNVTVVGMLPVINCPSNITVNATTGLCGATVNYAATETTAIPVSTITYSIAPGSFFATGTRTVTATATNAVGSSSCTFTVTVVDNQFPVLTGVPSDITVECNAVPVPAFVTSDDNCSTSAPVFTEVRTNGNCTGNYILTRKWSTTDASNNTTTRIQVITVQDTQAPVLSAAPTNTTVECNAIPAAAVLTSTDNCSTPAVVYTQTSTQNASATNAGYYNYTLTRTWTATDACGNTSSKTQVITVRDTQTPVVVCPVVAASCNNQVGNSKTVTLTATDNCGPVTVTYSLTGATVLNAGTGATLTQNFNIGTTQINWTVKDVSGNTSTCTTTVVINALPVASITAATADAFCNSFVLTGSSTLSGPFGYQWLFNNQSTCTTQQLTLGLTNPDGVYTLYTTDGNGCRSAIGATYNYQKQNLVNSYTILTYKDANIGKYNKVLSGSIGVMTSKGDADFKEYSSVTGAGSFVKAPRIDKHGSGIVINSQIIGIATPTLPVMLYNTASTKYLPDYTVAQYTTTTVNGNFDKLTVRKGANVTVTGNTFGTINVEYGASIKFTSANLNIESLLVDDGAKDNFYSYVRFAPNTTAKISNKVSIGSQVRLNPENNKVTIYMGDLKSDEEKFTVKGGDTKVIANVIMPNGKLRVTATDSDDDDHDNCDHRAHSSWSCKHRNHGHNACNHGAHNASDCNDDVYMTGLFIVESLDSKGNTVIWNSYDCAGPSTNIVLNIATPPVQTATPETKTTATAEVAVTEEELKVTVMPNPSTTFFTLKLESKYETPVNMRVMDGRGRVIDAKSKIGANSTIQIGHNYSSGTYYAELIQGTKRKVVQLIKEKE